ncbi:ATP-binding protein [Streptomyces sp. NPDC002851]
MTATPIPIDPNSTHVIWRWTSCTPGAVACARAALRCALDQLGFSGEAISDSVLAVSELVANAVEHAQGPYELRLRRTAADLICEVMDGDPRIPSVPASVVSAPFVPVPHARGGGLDALLTVLSERGRGLQVVEQLTCGVWGFRVLKRERAKVAWMAIPGP